VQRKREHAGLLKALPSGRVAPPLLAALGGCTGVQSTLDPRGPAAESIAQSHWVMFAGATFILVVVTAMSLYAVYRDPDRRLRLSPRSLIIGGGALFPVVVLSALLVYALVLMDNLRAPPPRDALVVRITAQQWAWQVHYPAAGDRNDVRLVNELRIPVGRPVLIELTSPDVIHSFWIPSLAGKLDVIPGHPRAITIRAGTAARLRGQCAEFCGLQHARMILSVIAEPAGDFDAWLAEAGGSVRPVQPGAESPARETRP
jgi:cytochrome c oxidase subunit 2